MAKKRLDIIINGRDRTQQAFDKVEGRLKGMGRSIAALGTVAAVGGGLAAFLNRFDEQIDQSGQRLANFEGEFRRLLSLGDNVENIENLRKQVLGYSTAWGIARDEVTRAMFDLQSGTANLDSVTRDELLRSALELTTVYGSALPESLTGLVKAYQIYGDEVASVADLQSRLAFLSEEGFLDAGDVARFLPDVAATAKAAGLSLDELIASLIVATREGGETSKTFTGVRNVLLRLADTQKAGIETTGTFTQRLRQLQSQIDSGGSDLRTIFGDEAISTSAILVNNVNELDAALANLGDTLPGTRDKLDALFRDSNQRFASIIQSLEKAQDNAIRSNNVLRERAIENAARTASIERQFAESGEVFNFLANNSVGKLLLRIEDDLANGGARVINEYKRIAEELTEAGNTTLATAFVDRFAAELNPFSTTYTQADADALYARIAEIERRAAEKAGFGEGFNPLRRIFDATDGAIDRTLADAAAEPIRDYYRKLAAEDAKARQQQQVTLDKVIERQAVLRGLRAVSGAEQRQQIDAELARLARVSEALTEQAAAEQRLQLAREQRADAAVRGLQIDALRPDADDGSLVAQYRLAIAEVEAELEQRRVNLVELIDANDLSDAGYDAAVDMLERIEGELDARRDRIREKFAVTVPADIFDGAERQILNVLANAGDEVSRIKLQQLDIAERFNAQERELQRILDSQLATEEQRILARERLGQLAEAEQIAQNQLEADRLEQFIGNSDPPRVEIGRFLTGLQYKNDRGNVLLKEEIKELRGTVDGLLTHTGELRRLNESLARGEPVLIGANIGGSN